MAIFDGFKLFVGKYYLKQLLKKAPERRRGYISLFQARTVGIIYDATNREDYSKVKDLIHFLKESQKNVIALGFINSKDPNMQLAPKLQFRYFGVEQLNWFKKPQGIEVDNFMEEDFDILIDLSLNFCYPLNYICKLTPAKFKVGIAQENGTEYLDMLIDISKKKTTEFFIIQVKHYLKLIKGKNEL
ncbi:MAG: hypothetical protein HRT72_11695 [Flavobacteriales bacterium]|nr:hypothetical protein [Flavobacteriales bacterium]